MLKVGDKFKVKRIRDGASNTYNAYIGRVFTVTRIGHDKDFYSVKEIDQVGFYDDEVLRVYKNLPDRNNK